MIINLLEQKKMVFSDGRNITQINVSLIVDVTNLIEVLNGIEGKNLNFPFHSLSLMFVDGGGTHLIRYADIFEESKSAVIHQLKKILKFPQNYFHVNVFLTTVEPPEHDRTYVLGKNKFLEQLK
jgi:hypothetical protein